LKILSIMTISIVLATLLLGQSLISTTSYASELKIDEIPRHPPPSSSFFGAPVLSEQAFLKLLNESLQRLRLLEKELDNISTPSSFSPVAVCNVTETFRNLRRAESWIPGWIYVNPSPLMTVNNSRLFNMLVAYSRYFSFKSVAIGVQPYDVIAQSKNLLPLKEVEERIADLEIAIRDKDLLRYEFDYIALAAYYISFKSWGPGEFFCKSYITSSEALITSSKGLTPSLNETLGVLILTKVRIWYVPRYVASCLMKWSVPPSSKVVSGEEVEPLINEIMEILRNIILYIPDSDLRFFIPAPYVLIRVKPLVNTTSTSTKGNISSASHKTISIKRLWSGKSYSSMVSESYGGFIDVRSLAKLANNILSLGQSQVASGSSLIGLKPLSSIPKESVNINLSRLLRRSSLKPVGLNAKKIGSFLAQAVVGESVISKVSILRSNALRFFTDKRFIATLALLATIIYMRDLKLRFLSKARSLEERVLVSFCYKTVLRKTKRYSGEKNAWETPREYLLRSTQLLPKDLAQLLQNVTELYEKVRYGNKGLSIKERELCYRILRGKLEG
jgi:hypothetical protein